jgi:Big-like domain-containing protein
LAASGFALVLGVCGAAQGADTTAPVELPKIAVPETPSEAITGSATEQPRVVEVRPTMTPTPEPELVIVSRPARTAVPTVAATTTTPAIAPAQTTAPTLAPTPTATHAPIVVTTPSPTVAPTTAPTAAPTAKPTATPTLTPTLKPNSPPQISRIAAQSGKVGQAFEIGVWATDPDGDRIALSCGGADKFTDYGNGTGLFQWTGRKGGTYSFTCTASDGKASSSTTFTITVN